MLTFDEALRYLTSLEKRGWRLGLDRMEAFLEAAGLTGAAVGREGQQPNFIHVAGTNGKGSVTANLQAMLIAQGYKTGAFFSPYVFDPRERVQIGAEMISREEYALGVEALIPAGDSLAETEFGGPTEFEFKTALGFWTWARHQSQWVALEVGLGGRLDATNVVTPRCSVIVSIGWDHMAILGDTLGKIAEEKAGIIKPGIPVVVGLMEPEPLRVIEAIAQERGAPIWRLGQEVRLSRSGYAWSVETPNGLHEGLVPGIPGALQPENMALSVAAMDAAGAIVDPSMVAAGVAKAFVPGRYQRIEARDRVWLMDGAHNVNAAQVLAESLRAEFGEQKLVFVTAMLTGHEPEPFYQVLAPHIECAIVAPIDFFRAANPSDLAKQLEPVLSHVSPQASLESALKAALEATTPGDVIVVTGSFYLVGQVGNALTSAE